MNRKTMWRAFLTIAPLTGVLAACAPGPADTLEKQASNDPNATASSEDGNSFPHTKEATGGQNGITDTKQRAVDESQAGTPIEVAKMHGAQKVAYATLGALLADFGVPMTPTPPPDDNDNGPIGNDKGGDEGDAPTVLATTAADLFSQGKSSLGAPAFGSRTPEMIVPSTSSLAKEFDIFIAAAPDVVANIGTSKRCPGVVLVQNNALTEDGISCLIGKPATADHLTLANKLVTDSGDPKNGIPLAVATLLAAAHISE